MDNTPLVSIVIPVYNRESIVQKAISSALSQTYRNIEVIVSDNASTDNTWNVLNGFAQQDKRVSIFRNNENLGPVRNWEACFRQIKGKYVKIIWSDDYITEDYLEKTIPILEQNDSCGFAYSKVCVEFSSGNKIDHVWGKTSLYETNHFIWASLMGTRPTPVSPGCAIFRSDIVNNLLVDIPNELNLDFSKYGAGNDLLLFLITCVNYKFFYYIDETLSFFKGGSDSITSNSGGKLGVYYNYAKFFFVNEYANKEIRDAFYTRLRFGENRAWVRNKKYKFVFSAVIAVASVKIRNFIKGIFNH